MARGRRALAAVSTLFKLKGEPMQRRNFVGIVGTVVLALLSTVALAGQVKEMPRTPIKPINKPSIVDVNSATEADIVSVGIERAVAKKIVEGRPWRSKRDL